MTPNSVCCVFKLSHTLVTTHGCVAFALKNNRIREEVPLRIENVDYQTGLNLCRFLILPVQKTLEVSQH